MFRALLAIVVGTLVLSALSTPPLYSVLVGWMGESVWPFSRVFDRVAMLWVLVFVILFRRDFPLGPLRDYLTRARVRDELSLLLGGLFLASLLSLSVLPFFIGDALIWNEKTPIQILGRLVKVVPAALLISLIEESFFRVLLLRRFQATFPLWLAVCSCSLLYAFAHFITPDKSWQYPGFGLFVGFDYLIAVAERFTLPGVAPAFLGMFLVGAVLCAVITRMKSLLFCIGLHSGWIVALKLSSFLTMKQADFQYAAGAGRRYFLLTEPVTWAIILMVGLVALYMGSLRNKEP